MNNYYWTLETKINGVWSEIYSDDNINTVKEEMRNNIKNGGQYRIIRKQYVNPYKVRCTA